MNTTPIADFMDEYAKSEKSRFHMPGHKGVGSLLEQFDITEIDGADSLYSARSIIALSEKNAGNIFGANTFYSTEGSSHCIRAMLYLASQRCSGTRPLIAAARNVHKSFLSAAALLDFDVMWLYSDTPSTYLSCVISPKALDDALNSASNKPCAVYITSPDYLGNMCDIKGLSTVCKKHGVLLLVDNAHGAYLKFLSNSLHPIDLGADMCCDSAHKTLPVLTGGAYLHISKYSDDFLVKNAKNALSLFGSTSPSYLILRSLDLANKYLSSDYKNKLDSFLKKIGSIKTALAKNGYTIFSDEPLKITIDTKKYGYTGSALAEILNNNGIVCEFYDADFLVLMLTPNNTDSDLQKLQTALLSVKKRDEIYPDTPKLVQPKKALSIRQAALSQSRTLPLCECVGKIYANINIPCPPAVPIIVCGEEIDDSAIAVLNHYNIKELNVI